MNSQRIVTLIWITAATVLAAGTPALAARKRSRILSVTGSQRVTLSGRSVIMPNELRVRLRKKVAFGITATRAIGDMRGGRLTLRFSSRRWSGHDIQTETFRSEGGREVSTVSSNGRPFRYVEGLDRTPGKKTITNSHTLTPREVYPFQAGAAFAIQHAGNGTRVSIRRYGPHVRISGASKRVDVPGGATVYDAMKAVAYMDGIKRGLLKIERIVRVDEFRGEWTLQRANVAMASNTRAFESALSTFIYQGYLLPFVDRFRTMDRATLEGLLDTHMDVVRHQSTNPGQPYTQAMARAQLKLGARSAGNLLTILNDLVDSTMDDGLTGQPDVLVASRAEVLQTLAFIPRLASPEPATWALLIDYGVNVGRFGLQGSASHATARHNAVIENGLSYDTPIGLPAEPQYDPTLPSRPTLPPITILPF